MAALFPRLFMEGNRLVKTFPHGLTQFFVFSSLIPNFKTNKIVFPSQTPDFDAFTKKK